jgi:spore germination protein
MTIHVVRWGETAEGIAAAYGVDPARLAADNAVPADGALAAGQTLVVRLPRTVHTVRPGETLFSIARRYGVTVRALWRRNWALGGGSALLPGQELVVDYWEEKLGTCAANGYAYPHIDPALLDAEVPYLTYLSPFTCGLSEDGGLLPLSDGPLLRSARSRGTRPVLHLSASTESGQFDSQRARLLLTDAAVQDALTAQLVRQLEEKDLSGVDVDFEYLSADLAEPYAAFLRRLRSLLAPRGRFVWVALAPKTRADQPGLLYEAHDYAALGAAADGCLLMTYEWGYAYGEPMAVAPLPSVREVLDYAVTEIPPEKLFLGVPNYGYDWPLPFVRGATRARSLSNQEAIRLALAYGAAISYDESAASPHFFYSDGAGTAHTVWFEDARSLAAKLSLAAEYGLAGVGFWNLMRPFSQAYLVLDALYDVE